MHVPKEISQLMCGFSHSCAHIPIIMIGLLFAGFGVSQFLFYTVMPQVMRFSSALIVNLSLLTADFYTLFFGIFVFHYKVSFWLVAQVS